MTILSSLGLKRPQAPRPVRTGDYALTGVHVVRPGGEHLSGFTIGISGGVIGPITPDGPGDGEYAGCFVLPGLVDMHLHLPPASPLPLSEFATLLYIRHGITTVREAGDLDGTAISAASATARAGHPGPRVIYCGPFVGAGKPTFKNTISLATEADAESAAYRVAATGARFMKFYDGLTEPMIRALEHACDRHGLKIMGHVPAALDYETARIREVQHFFGVPKPAALERPALVNRACDWGSVGRARMDEIASITLREGIANTPTIVAIAGLRAYLDFEAARERVSKIMPPFYADVVWNPEFGRINTRTSKDYIQTHVDEAIDKKKMLVGRLHRAGAELFLGTDTAQPFLIPGESLWEEMAMFADAGVSLRDIWRLATEAAGNRLGVAGLGTLQPGAPADLLLFRRDPTHSLDARDSLQAVVRDGRLYTTADLDRALAEYRDYFNSALIAAMSRRGAKRLLKRAVSR